MTSLIVLSALGMLCWVVMFLAGTDVWHFARSPDFWRQPGPPNSDLRAFAFAFYSQFLILVAMIAVASWTALKSGPTR